LYDFSATDGSDKDLLGGKGAGLARMTSLGLPVPPGFTITTDVCRYIMESGEVPPDLWDQVDDAIERVEQQTRRTFGVRPAPILLSVRSGAKFSMPGMMDSVLNIGINEKVAAALIGWSGDAHFAWDAYRRFVQMYSDVVLGINEDHFQTVLRELRTHRGVDHDSELTATDLKEATRRFQQIVEDQRPGELPSVLDNATARDRFLQWTAKKERHRWRKPSMTRRRRSWPRRKASTTTEGPALTFKRNVALSR
jgi:pyruvate,orthophosphate dikinase